MIEPSRVETVVGSRLSRYSEFNIDKFAKDLIEKSRDAAIDIMVDEAWEEALEHPGAAEAAMKYALANALSRVVREARPKSSERSPAEKKTNADDVKEELDRQAKLLGMLAPNGKLLSQCTLGECAAFGSWYAQLAKGKPPTDLVIVHYDEKMLRRLQTWK